MAHRIAYLRKATNTVLEYVILDITNLVVAIFFVYIYIYIYIYILYYIQGVPGGM